MKVFGNVPRVLRAIKLSTYALVRLVTGRVAINQYGRTGRLPQEKLRGKIKT